MQTNETGYERALIIREPWIELILAGVKTWEMRATKTKVRGRIGLIRQGSGLIVGEADLVDCLTFDHTSAFHARVDKHGIDEPASLLFKWRVAWVLDNVKRYDTPIPYDHPQGAVIWVRVPK